MVGVVGMLAVALGLAGSSRAAPYSRQPVVSVSTHTLAEGATITVRGTDYVPGVVVDLALHTVTVGLGSATPDTSGAFSTAVTLPQGITGAHTIVGAGAAPNDTASTPITIGAAGGLATAGVAIIGIGALCLVLLAGGGAMLLAGHRRKIYP